MCWFSQTTGFFTKQKHLYNQSFKSLSLTVNKEKKHISEDESTKKTAKILNVPQKKKFQSEKVLKSELIGFQINVVIKGSHLQKKAASFWKLSKSGLNPPPPPTTRFGHPWSNFCLNRFRKIIQLTTTSKQPTKYLQTISKLPQ